MQAPPDGCAVAKLLQDSPYVIQVAGCSQPHSESDTLGAGEQAHHVGSQNQA